MLPFQIGINIYKCFAFGWQTQSLSVGNSHATQETRHRGRK